MNLLCGNALEGNARRGGGQNIDKNVIVCVRAVEMMNVCECGRYMS